MVKSNISSVARHKDTLMKKTEKEPSLMVLASLETTNKTRMQEVRTVEHGDEELS